jgi:hypothetical protein
MLSVYLSWVSCDLYTYDDRPLPCRFEVLRTAVRWGWLGSRLERILSTFHGITAVAPGQQTLPEPALCSIDGGQC